MEVIFLKKGTKFVFTHPFEKASESKEDIIVRFTCPVSIGGTKRAEVPWDVPDDFCFVF